MTPLKFLLGLLLLLSFTALAVIPIFKSTIMTLIAVWFFIVAIRLVIVYDR